MATRRAGTVKKVIDESENEIELRGEAPPDFAPDDLAVSDLLGELGGDAEAAVRIYRQGKGGYRDLTLIDEVGVMDFTPLMLKYPPYGGGEFRIHARSKGGMICNRMLKVEPAPAQPQAAPGGVTLAQVADVVAQTLRGMTPQQPAPGPTRKEMLEEMAMMAALFKPAQSDSPRSDPLAMIRTVIELQSSLRGAMPVIPESGEVGGNALLLALIDKFGTPIAEAVKSGALSAQANMPAPVASQPAPQLRGPAPEPATPPAPQPSPEETEMNLRLKLALTFLCDQAQANNEVTTYADMVLDNVPEADLRTLMDAPDWLDRLAAHHAPVKNFAEWFGKLQAEVMEQLNAAPESDDSTPPGENVAA